MRFTFALLRGAALVLVLALAACSPAADTAPPVATPTVTLSTSVAPIGSPIDMTYRFVVAGDAPRFREDYWVFVHFVDVDGELMWTDDHEPPTPTTQWQPGQTIEYSRTLFVPRFPYVGQARVIIGLYSRETGERLPLAGENVGQRAVRAATFEMRVPDDTVQTVFRAGWHSIEIDRVAGVEWQWSRGEAVITFRNPGPGRGATFFLDLDQPVRATPEPQRVELRIGDRVVDGFTLEPARRELRRIALTPEQLGEAATVDVVLTVDQTFVPSAVPELRSNDIRELGVRVFRAYVQPQ